MRTGISYAYPELPDGLEYAFPSLTDCVSVSHLRLARFEQKMGEGTGVSVSGL